MSNPGSQNEIDVVLNVIYDNLVAGYDKAKSETRSFATEVGSTTTSAFQRAESSASRFFSETQSGSTKLMQASAGVRKLSSDMEEGAGAAAHVGGSVATATREFRALFDEVSAGRWHNVPGTMAIIANRVFGISGAALLAGVGVAALVAGLVYLAYRADEAAASLTKLDLAANFSGDIGVTRSALQGIVSDVENFGNVSRANADIIVSAWERTGNQSSDSIRGLSLATIEYMQATGEKAPEAVKALTKLLDDQKVTVDDVAKAFPGVTTKEAENYIQIQKLGDAHKTTAALMLLMSERSKGLGDNIVELNSRTFASIGNFTRMTAAVIEDGTAGFIPLGSTIEEVIKDWHALTDAMSYAFGWVGDVAKVLHLSSEEARVHADIVAENTKRYHDQTAAQAAAIAATKTQKDSSDQELQAALRLGAGMESTQGHLKQLSDEIGKWKKALTDNPNAPAAVIDQLKDRIVAAQEEIDRAKQKGARTAAAALRDEGSMEIAQLKENISEINANESLGTAERLTIITKMWNDLLENGKFNARQRLEIEKAMNDSIAAEHKQAASTELTIDRDNSATALQVARIGFEQRRELLREEVAAHQISKVQELEQLAAIRQEELVQDEKAIDAAEVGYAHDTEFYRQQENRRVIIRAQAAADIATIATQETDAEDAEVRQSVEYQKRAFSELTSASNSMINNITSGHMTMWASLGLALGDFVKKELAADAQYLLAHIFYNQAELAADKTLSQEGLLLSLFTETRKTAATATGAATRLATTQAAAVAGNAIEVKSGSASIMNDANKAYAGTYSAVAQIPYIGPYIAPAAAAAAFAAVAAMDTLTSLDVGAWEVPRNMPAMLHAGEQVVPKNYAQGLREAASGGGAPRSGGTGGDTYHSHATYAPTIIHNEPATLRDQLAKDGSYMLSWFQARLRDGDLKMAVK